MIENEFKFSILLCTEYSNNKSPCKFIVVCTYSFVMIRHPDGRRPPETGDHLKLLRRTHLCQLSSANEVTNESALHVDSQWQHDKLFHCDHVLCLSISFVTGHSSLLHSVTDTGNHDPLVCFDSSLF